MNIGIKERKIMTGLSLEQEAVLAICRDNKDRCLNDPNSFEYSALEDLKSNMIDIKETYMGGIRFHGMLPAGQEHYNEARKERKQFKNVSDAADELLMRLAVEDKRKREAGEDPYVSEDLADPNFYRELQDGELIDVQWADNKPYFVRVTEGGRRYVEGDFMNQQQNNFSPTINITNQNQANSNATIEGIAINAAISELAQLSNVGEEDKRAAESAARELDAAAKSKDKKSFAEKLEILAGILKSSTEIAKILLPFVGNAIHVLFN